MNLRYQVMQCIMANPLITMSEIAEELGCEQRNVNYAIKGLVAADQIKRQFDDVTRSTGYVITQKGKDKLKEPQRVTHHAKVEDIVEKVEEQSHVDAVKHDVVSEINEIAAQVDADSNAAAVIADIRKALDVDDKYKDEDIAGLVEETIEASKALTSLSESLVESIDEIRTALGISGNEDAVDHIAKMKAQIIDKYDEQTSYEDHEVNSRSDSPSDYVITTTSVAVHSKFDSALSPDNTISVRIGFDNNVEILGSHGRAVIVRKECWPAIKSAVEMMLYMNNVAGESSQTSDEQENAFV